MKRHRDYRNVCPDDYQKTRQPGERIRITGRIFIDYSVFKKTPEEKLKLKIVKAQNRI